MFSEAAFIFSEIMFVSQVIKMCADEGTRPKVADFGDRVEDSNFLNQLQNGVARWIREIQKVGAPPPPHAASPFPCCCKRHGCGYSITKPFIVS